ncbi:hypothetical protein CSA56_02185, partial [candidate division KSB3 bacterium]
MTGRDGTIHYLYRESRREFDKLGNLTGEFGILHEITARKHLEKELRKLATTDSLTGAANFDWCSQLPALLWNSRSG